MGSSLSSSLRGEPCDAAESGGMLGAKDEASADAAEMIARAKAAVKQEKAGPGVSVLHQVARACPYSPPIMQLWGASTPVGRRTMLKCACSCLASDNASRHALRNQAHWRRIVLDEAHSIKDRRCSTARAVFALTSAYKWALSGTPLQARAHQPLLGF